MKINKLKILLSIFSVVPLVFLLVSIAVEIKAMETNEKEFNKKNSLGLTQLTDAKEIHRNSKVYITLKECQIALDAGDTLLEACKQAEIVIKNLKDQCKCTHYIDNIISLEEKIKILEWKNIILEEIFLDGIDYLNSTNRQQDRDQASTLEGKLKRKIDDIGDKNSNASKKQKIEEKINSDNK